MNANNLMAVSTADGISAGAGAPKGRNGSVGNRAQTTSGKNSFSDTFDALQKGMNADTSKTQTRNAPAGPAQTNAPKVESNVPAQDTQDVTEKAPKNVDAKPTGSGAEKTTTSADDVTAASSTAAFAAIVNMEMPSPAADEHEGLDDALVDILERYGLTADQLGDTKVQNVVQNLLQALPEDAAKSRNLLLALEGQPIAQENASSEFGALVQKLAAAGQENAPLKKNTDTPAAPVLRLAELDASSSAQLRAAVNTELPLPQENAPAIAAEAVSSALTAAENTAQRNLVTTNTVVEEQNTQVMAEKISAPLLRAQAEPVQSTARSAADLVGNQLTVDENVDAASPLTVLAQRTMRHDTMQGDTAGQQGGAQQDAAQLAQSETQQTVRMNSNVTFEIPTRTTEPAPQPAQPIAAQTGTSPLPMQDVNAPAPTPEAQRPQPDYEIPRQIVEQARLLRTLNDTQMVIRLHPEHLGELTLRVSVGSNGSVQASFHSDNAQVRNVIENSLVQLRQELNNQGLKVDRVGVYAGLADGQMPQGQGQEAWQQSSSHRGETQIYTRGDADDYLDEAEGLSPAAAQANIDGSVGTDGVDYRV
jgi:flagellar hook-length control protein fliK